MKATSPKPFSMKVAKNCFPVQLHSPFVPKILFPACPD